MNTLTARRIVGLLGLMSYLANVHLTPTLGLLVWKKEYFDTVRFIRKAYDWKSYTVHC